MEQVVKAVQQVVARGLQEVQEVVAAVGLEVVHLGEEQELIGEDQEEEVGEGAILGAR